ncbi:HAD-IIA family hydrolase [soil metagenome]
MAWVLDLDGVIWLAEEPIPGAPEAVARLHVTGEDLVFVTNNSNPTVADNKAKLSEHGIEAEGHVVTSAMAAAELVEPDERVLICAGPGVRDAVLARGAKEADGDDVDVVVVGFHREFDYERMRVAATAVRRGARLLATNDDATYPTPDERIPGAGAILAGIEKAAGVSATVAGKPYRPMADLIRARFGDSGLVVGDRADTDGRLARALGYRFALVLTGVTKRGDLPVDPEPDILGDDLTAVVDEVLD